MANLIQTFEISEARKSGNVNQELVLQVEYDPKEDSIEMVRAFVYQNGKLVAEISKLLNNGPGNPLEVMLTSIDWREIYYSEKEEKSIPAENRID